MKRVNTFLVTVFLFAAALLSSPLAAQNEKKDEPRFRIRLDSVGVFQVLEHSNESDTLTPLNSGFQAALANLELHARVVDGISLYGEFYLSSKHHAGELTDHEGYILISHLPSSPDIGALELLNLFFKYIDVKAGHFEVDFGNQHLTRSDNADVTRNPLIGNYVADPNTVESGVEIIGHHGKFHWLAGVGNGVTVEDFRPGRDYSRHGKIWFEPENRLYNVAFSVYRADHSGNPTGYPNNGSFSELFAGNRSGSRYSRVIDGNAEAGQINMGKGQDVIAYQLDSAFKYSRMTFSGLYGFTKDSDINGSDPGQPQEKWHYYGGEVKLDVGENSYVAARYSGAQSPLYVNTPMDARIDRVQVGYGRWIGKALLLKAEYVTQWYRGFTVRHTDDPKFYGVLGEVAVAIGN